MFDLFSSVSDGVIRGHRRQLCWEVYISENGGDVQIRGPRAHHDGVKEGTDVWGWSQWF